MAAVATQSALYGVRVSVDELVALRSQARGLNPTRPQRSHAPSVGQKLSRFRGRGVDYLESRNYQPGDEIRHMDWRVTARTGVAHTKIFQEERERQFLLVLDLSPSMYFGTRKCFKSVQAARLAALLAWAVVRAGDRVGAVGLFGDAHDELKASNGPQAALAVVRALVKWGVPQAADPEHPAPPMAQALRRLARPGAVVLLLSDFEGMNLEKARALAALRSHIDLIAVAIHDPLETAPPPPGQLAFSDGREHLSLDISAPSRRAAWLEGIARARGRRMEALETAGIPLLDVSTEDQPLKVLQQLFPARGSRARR